MRIEQQKFSLHIPGADLRPFPLAERRLDPRRVERITQAKIEGAWGRIIEADTSPTSTLLCAIDGGQALAEVRDAGYVLVGYMDRDELQDIVVRTMIQYGLDENTSRRVYEITDSDSKTTRTIDRYPSQTHEELSFEHWIDWVRVNDADGTSKKAVFGIAWHLASSNS